MFGKRKVPFGQEGAPSPQPAPDADGRRRVFGEDVWEGPHADFLRGIGISPDDPSNIIPDENDLQLRLTAERRAEEDRRTAMNLALQRKHGQGAYKPYFVFGDGVWNGEHGPFLMRVMELFPYEEWNTLYLAFDHETSVLVDLPVHPGSTIDALDKRIGEELAKFKAAHDHLHATMGEVLERNYEFGLFEQFSERREAIRQGIRDYAEELKEPLVELISDLWRKAAARAH